jgi:hypothetical protein
MAGDGRAGEVWLGSRMMMMMMLMIMMMMKIMI